MIFTEKGSQDIGVKLFGKQDKFIFGQAEFEALSRHLMWLCEGTGPRTRF